MLGAGHGNIEDAQFTEGLVGFHVLPSPSQLVIFLAHFRRGKVQTPGNFAVLIPHQGNTRGLELAQRLVAAKFRKDDDIHAESLGFVHGHHADDARRFVFLQRVMFQMVAETPPVIIGFSFGVELGSGINERDDFRRVASQRLVHPIADGGRETTVEGGSHGLRAKK